MSGRHDRFLAPTLRRMARDADKQIVLCGDPKSCNACGFRSRSEGPLCPACLTRTAECVELVRLMEAAYERVWGKPLNVEDAE